MLSMVSHIYWKQSVNGHCLHLIVAEIMVAEITLPLLLPNLHTLTRILILFDLISFLRNVLVYSWRKEKKVVILLSTPNKGKSPPC